MTHYDYGNQNYVLAFSKSLRSGDPCCMLLLKECGSERFFVASGKSACAICFRIASACLGAPAYERSAPTAYMFAVRLLPLLWRGIPPQCSAFFLVDLAQQAVQLCRIAGKQLCREPFICKMVEHRLKRSFRICAFDM